MEMFFLGDSADAREACLATPYADEDASKLLKPAVLAAAGSNHPSSTTKGARDSAREA